MKYIISQRILIYNVFVKHLPESKHCSILTEIFFTGGFVHGQEPVVKIT